MKANQYLQEDGYRIGYCTEEDIDKEMNLKEKAKFREWIFGQTCPMVDGKLVYFAHDVNRFLDKVRHGIPTFWD